MRNRAAIGGILLRMLILSGCGGGGGAPPRQLTEEEAQGMLATSGGVAQAVLGTFDPEDPEGSLRQIARNVGSMPNVVRSAPKDFPEHCVASG